MTPNFDIVARIVIGALAAIGVFAVVVSRSNQRFSARLTKLSRLALALLAAAIFGVSLAMMGQFLGVQSPWFALNAAADILGFIALTRPVFSWNPPGPLQRVSAWERSGAAYRMLGVSYFGAAIRRPPLRYLNSMVYLGPHGGALSPVRSSMLGAEGAHFWATVFTLPLLAFVILRGWRDSALWVVGFLIVLNVYPALHLRYARSRVERLMARARIT